MNYLEVGKVNKELQLKVLKGRDHLGGLEIGKVIILKCILK
jgi:hypothetical protein